MSKLKIGTEAKAILIKKQKPSKGGFFDKGKEKK